MQACEHPEDVVPEDFVDELLTRRQASIYLAGIGVRRMPSTLARLLSIGADGPPCLHEGRKAFYPKRQLHEWGARQLTQVRRSPFRRKASGAGSSGAAQFERAAASRQPSRELP